MASDLEKRIDALKLKFLSLPNSDDRYTYLIEWGQKAPAYPSEWKIPDYAVSGCQSLLYLKADLQEGKIYFIAHSDALISKGLATLLVHIYSGESPQTILLNPPTFLQEMGLFASLSPHRSNGLASIYDRMKQEALKHLLQSSLINP